MSKEFVKLVKKAISSESDTIILENESEGKNLYMISSGSGIKYDLSLKQLYEIFVFLQKKKSSFSFVIDNVKHEFNVKFRRDFGEEVFTLKIKHLIENK